MAPDTPDKKGAPLLPTLIIVVVLAAAGAFFFLKQPEPPAPAQTVTRDIAPAPAETPWEPLPETTPPAQEEGPESTAEPTDTRVEETLPPTPCQIKAEEILAFFQHLDQEEYIAAYQLETSSHLYLTGLVKKLFANPPIVVRENDDLFSILKNMTHLYRVLGKKNLHLLKDVLANEAEELEPLLALFYSWTELAPRCTVEDLPTDPAAILDLPLANLYEYAGFFLNTIGGQSYLYRRVPRLRLLVKYYAILVLDRANDAKMNRYGLDIRFPLDTLIAEMETFSQLTYRDEYLGRLVDLQEKYRLRYGEPGEAPEVK